VVVNPFYVTVQYNFHAGINIIITARKIPGRICIPQLRQFFEVHFSPFQNRLGRTTTSKRMPFLPEYA